MEVVAAVVALEGGVADVLQFVPAVPQVWGMGGGMLDAANWYYCCGHHLCILRPIVCIWTFNALSVDFTDTHGAFIRAGEPGGYLCSSG